MSETNCVEASLEEERVQVATRALVGIQTATRLAETFKALSDPTRIRIVSLLIGSELCVCDLAAALGMSQSAVSHQLRILRDRRDPQGV